MIPDLTLAIKMLRNLRASTYFLVMTRCQSTLTWVSKHVGALMIFDVHA